MAQGEGKVAVVTGASQGIGKAAAQALLKEGYRVAFAGRRVEMLEAAIAEAGVPKDQAIAVALRGDLSINAISPNTPPLPTFSTLRPVTESFTEPSSTTYIT